LAYLKGIVSATERKNGWHLAVHTGESRPDGMQRLLNSAVWDADLVRDDLRAYILEWLGDPHALLVIDETSFRKRGQKSAGSRSNIAAHPASLKIVSLPGLRRFSRPHAAQSGIVFARRCRAYFQ
jgi:hypothetical protein